MTRTKPALIPSFQRPPSQVAIRSVASYEQDLSALIYETLREFDLPVQGKGCCSSPTLSGRTRSE